LGKHLHAALLQVTRCTQSPSKLDLRGLAGNLQAWIGS
jgi:hypothetical protein